MLSQYIQAAMNQAKYKILADNEGYYGEIPGFQGVWANAETLEGCRNELVEVLKEWIFLCLSDNLLLPTENGLRLGIEKV